MNIYSWDTAGQERFKCISQAYYRNSQVIAIVFDMTKPKTLEDVTCWLESALAVNTIEKPFLFLVGSKCDLLPQKEFEIMERSAMEMAKGMQAEYWSVSAKTGFNIQELFNRIAGLSFESSVKKSIIESAISLGGIRPSQILSGYFICKNYCTHDFFFPQNQFMELGSSEEPTVKWTVTVDVDIF